MAYQKSSILGSLGSLTLLNVIVLIVGLMVFWMIVSIPVYIAGKIVTGGKSSLWNAMAATLLGPTVYVIVLFIADFFLGAIMGNNAYIWAFILAFVAWLWVYKSVFKTGWLGAIGISIIAVIVFVVVNVLLGQMFGIHLPISSYPQV